MKAVRVAAEKPVKESGVGNSASSSGEVFCREVRLR
jgi:hypothetical protein